MKRILLLTLTGVLLMAVSCRGGNGDEQKTKHTGLNYAEVAIPAFDADSALWYTESQLAFGYRHHEAVGREKCADFLASTMSRWCDTVVKQRFTTTLWTGQKVTGCNIIASIAPKQNNRVLLAAHWDSRRWADHDVDTNNWRKPLPGANDGASAVAMLMEMARIMSAMPPDVGVDFVFFDLEDQGIAEWAGRYEDNTWCKGSQHWAQNPHRMFYTAKYGILFDMVGTSEPRFTKEEISMNFAPGLMNKMWQCAASLGYGNVFVDELSSGIMDDHLYVNQILHIPTIDVVQNSRKCSFYEHWHTVNDDLAAVDKNSLKIVATVAMKLIYADFPYVDDAATTKTLVL